MTRDEILKEIKRFAKQHNYGITQYAEKIAEAKRRMGKGWVKCPCHRDGLHFCGSQLCTMDIAERGVCGCNLYYDLTENGKDNRND